MLFFVIIESIERNTMPDKESKTNKDIQPFIPNTNKEIQNIEDFKNEFKHMIESAKRWFLSSVKEEYFSKLFIKINSLKNNESELYTKHFTFIKKVLRQVSLDGITIIFKDKKTTYHSYNITYYKLPDPEDPKNSLFEFQYFEGFGTAQTLLYKILLPIDNFSVLSTKRYHKNRILPDISIFHPADKFWLNVLMEQAKTFFLESWKNKGVLEIGYTESVDDAISDIWNAFEFGFAATQMELNPSGNNNWDDVKDVNLPFKNGRINSIQFNSAKEMDDIYSLLKKGVSDLFKSKGLITAEDQKNGTYNEHSSETEGKDQERNEAIIEVVRIFNKNISKILSFLEGREINFEFILENETITKNEETLNEK